MTKLAWRLALATCGIGLAVAAAVSLVALAVTREPEFYAQATAEPREALKRSSDEFLQNATALASNVQRTGRWSAVFSADEVNGWLAEDLEKNHGGILPKTLSDPRVAIDGDLLKVACRYDQGFAAAVVSLELEPYLAEPNVVGVRIRTLRAGIIPLPMQPFLDGVSKAAERADWRLRWDRTDGDPVALVTMSLEDSDGELELDSVELRDGQLYVAGVTADPSEPLAAGDRAPDDASVAARSGPSHTKTQR